MTRTQQHIASLVVGLLVLAGAVFATAQPARAPIDPLAWLLFTGLFIFTNTFGFPLGGGNVNLTPVATVGALLALGPLPTVWTALAGSLANMALRWLFYAQLETRREPGGWLPVVGLGLANGTIVTASSLAGAAVYRAAGGTLPLAAIEGSTLGPYLLLVVTYSTVNYGLIALYLAAGARWASLRNFAHALPQVATFELAPQVFTPLLPLTYHRLGAGPFFVLALALVSSSLIVRSQSLTGRRLQQRLADLSTLNAVGQAVAASLHIETILATLHEQLPRVMPVDSLFVALYDPESDEVSFPLAVEQGTRAAWNSRRAGHGLTEHILRTRQPLLIPADVAAAVRALGVEPIGRIAASWVGVPIIAGSEALGVLALQSFSAEAEPYTAAHRDLLVTIASQLGAALNNARLYRQTDQALAQRVQQLSSILQTTREGVLLLDSDSRVLMANRALAGFTGLPMAMLTEQTLTASDDLMARLGMSLAEFAAERLELANGQELTKRTYTTRDPSPRDLERTLAPVRAASGAIAGWLVILRDVTEERALAHLREDLTHMLIHDLRSPLASILTSLSLIGQMARPHEPLDPAVIEMVRLAETAGHQQLRLINQLLDIARLEAGAVPLRCEPLAPAGLLAGAAQRAQAAAEAAGIRLVVAVDADVPCVPADAELIGRVLDNLADNAIKFSPDRSEVRLSAHGDGGRAVVFVVADQGPGIAPAVQAELFRKYYRPNGLQGRRAGTGLGLAFCKLAVEAHRGRIWVESEPGHGTTFSFSLAAAIA